VNILFITANPLGDAVLSTGVLGALIDRHPAARITVACGPLPAPLFAAIPEVARVIALVKQPRHLHWRTLWAETVGTVWDLIVDLRNSVVSRLLRRRGLTVFRGPEPRQHMVEALSAAAGIVPPAPPRLWLDAALQGRVAAELGGDRPFLALAPGAKSVGKRWPAARYAALARRLTAAGGPLAGAAVAILGATGEQAEAAPIRDAVPPGSVIDLVGRTDPLLAAGWLARADLYVGNDSGLTHLAAAAGAPTLGLFGPGMPARYRPWGPRAAYLAAADDPDRTVDLCKIDDRLALAEMEKLSVDQVLEAAIALHAKVQGR
jgi:lipopolysaccharide export system permease protein